jgi:hypothetical protein
MGAAINLHDLTDEEVALVEGLVRLLRQRHSPGSGEGEGDWGRLASASFAEDWENDQDAAYDQWRESYGVPER